MPLLGKLAPPGASVMHLSNQSLLFIIVVGIVAGWLAGRVMEGGGFGLIGDLIVGLIGAFIGDWLLRRLGIHLGTGIVALIINAFIGAVVLLLILRLIGRSRGRGHSGKPRKRSLANLTAMHAETKGPEPSQDGFSNSGI